MDAGTASAALARFRSLPQVPMDVWISANSHVGDVFADPFFPGEAAPIPTFDAQWSAVTGFMAEVRAHQTVARQIHYYVLGAKRVLTTEFMASQGYGACRVPLCVPSSLGARQRRRCGRKR